MKNILTLLLFLSTAAGLSAQCLNISTCTNNGSSCDLTTNDAQLWNELYWWDNINQSFNLADTPLDLTATAVDTCSGATITVKYLLFLDLNGDDTLETVIKSWDPPAPGTVDYNNFNNPNYDGGTPRIFDERPVPADQKYQFGLQTISAGNTLTARLRWNTTAAPGTFVIPELPYGNHKIQWVFEDNLTNEATCNYDFNLRDCKSPTVVCLNGLSVNIMPTGEVNLWASDFLQYGEDNTTPTPLLKYGIRKCGQGTGFPVNGNGDPILSVNFNCNELGIQCVELWAKDASGNADFCETYVIVQDNANNCGNGSGGSEIPQIVCHNGISVQLQNTGTASVSTGILLQYATDNNTPSNLLEFGMRKCGSGAGFPVDGQGNPVETLSFDNTELGTQCIELWVRDTDGNADYCETYVIILNTTGTGGDAPTVVCINGLSVNILPTGFVQLWAQDFLQYLEDNDTPSGLIALAIRKSGTGTGFPVNAQGIPTTSIVYDCYDLGTQAIELWAIDTAGNADYCETYVIVQDNAGNCGGLLATDLSICINRWCDNAPVTGVTIDLSENANIPGNAHLTSSGCYQLDSNLLSLNILPYAQIVPGKNDDYNNGLSSLDLVKISRHILGFQPLSTYAMIAADINKSGSITTFDIVEERKLITGIYNAIPNNTSWRFVDANHVFSNPNNPFQGVIPEKMDLLTAAAEPQHQAGFIAIKVGDVDCDATPGAIAPANDRQKQFLSISDATLEAGETVEIPVQFTENGAWLALQAGFVFDPQLLEIEAVVPGNLPDMDQNSFAAPAPGIWNMVWFVPQPFQVSAGDVIFSLRIRARQSLQLSQVLQFTHRTPETPRHLQAEGYDAVEKPYRFQLIYRGNPTSGAINQTIIFEAQPNPTAGAAMIPVQLAEPESVQLTLTDMSGKLIWNQELTLPDGMQQLEIPAEVLEKAGVYLWHVRAGEAVAGGKLIRI